METKPALTEKEQRFASEYAATANGAESARRAGYSDVGGGARVVAAKLLKKPAVRALVDRLIAERAERVELEGDQIIADLQRLARWSMLPVPVLDRAGRPTGVEKPLDGALAVRCLDLLGKSLALWTDRVEQTVDSEISLAWQAPVQCEDDDLAAWTEAPRKQSQTDADEQPADEQAEDPPSPPAAPRDASLRVVVV